MTGLSTNDRERLILAHCSELEDALAASKAEALKLKLDNMRLTQLANVQAPSDEALRAQLQRTLVVMSRVGKMLSKHAPAADEREAFAEFFALLAEHGCHPGSEEQKRLELAFAEWEGRR